MVPRCTCETFHHLMIPAKILAVITNAGNERYGEHKRAI
jgi:hypothetical protein